LIAGSSGRNASLTPLVVAHGIVTAAWLLLFLVQAILVATGRTDIHRRTGLLGGVLAIPLIALGCLTVIGFARRGYDLSGDITRVFAAPGAPTPSTAALAPILLGPLWNVVEFGALVAAGFWYRRRPDIHKRLMLFALLRLTVVPVLHLMGTLVRRWPALQGPGAAMSVLLPTLLLFTVPVADRVSRDRIHPVSLWVPFVFLAWSTVAAVIVFPSDWWREFAAWAIR
jgi:hypothetical protein